jgi:hypothetical protein
MPRKPGKRWAMTFDTPLAAALFLVALVAAVATCAVALFRSTVALEQWLDAAPARAIPAREAAHVETEPVTLDRSVDTRAA